MISYVKIAHPIIFLLKLPSGISPFTFHHTWSSIFQLETNFGIQYLSKAWGGIWLADGRGSAAWFSESHPPLIIENCHLTHFYDEFRRKASSFWLYFANSWKTHPFLRKICRKGPLFREFWAQKPTHIGGTYPYPQHVLYPSPRAVRLLEFWKWMLS